MSLAVAIQMDPIETIDIDADSTFVLALEAQRRGHALFHYLPQAMIFKGGRLYARIRALEVRREPGDFYSLGAPQVIDLATMDVVLMRQDPPFDMAYITATHLLEHVHPETLVINDPVHVRNAPEKLFVTHFSELMPPTVITSDVEHIRAFRDEHKDVVLKPLFGNGGAGVFHLRPEDENLNALLEMFTDLYREPIMVQRYIPDIRDGDKRIILIEGEAAGGVSRIPKAGEARANFHAGGRAAKTELTPRDRDICEAIGPSLKELGLLFVGIDVIGAYLTEINVTSPTGLQEINRLNDDCLEIQIWEAIETQYAGTRRIAPV